MTGVAVSNIKISVKDGKACQKILTVKVPQEEITKEYDLFYKAVAPQAKIPGFRPGRAPRNILENHYAGEAKERVLKNLISDSFKEALQQSELNPVVYPSIEDVDFNDKQLTYKAMIEVRPTVKLSKVKGLSAKYEEAKVESKDVDEELKRIQDSMAQFKAVEDRAAQMGDFITADYVCTCEGEVIDDRKDDWIELREDSFLKDLVKELVGTKAEDEKKVEVTFPKDFANTKIAGKKATFEVKVKDIKIKNLPELNDELAKEAGEFETLADLKAKIEKDLLANRQQEKEAAFEQELLEQLRKSNKLEVPKGLVEKRRESLLEEAKMGFLRQGATEEDFEKQKEALGKGMQMEAEKQVHVAFLLDEIVNQEELKVEDADWDKKYEQMAERVKQPVEKIKEFYSSNENARGSLYEQIRNEKAINFLKEHAKRKR